jgi:hypothetical protein
MSRRPFIGVQDLVGMMIPTLGLTLLCWFFSNGRFPLTPSLCIGGLIGVGMLVMANE